MPLNDIILSSLGEWYSGYPTLAVGTLGEASGISLPAAGAPGEVSRLFSRA